MRTSTTRPRARALCRPLALLLACALVLPGAASAATPLKEGSKGPRVAAVQKALRQRVDRVFGPATTRAVERLQRRHGLPVVGVVGPRTWPLIKRLRARQRAQRPVAAHGSRPARSRRRVARVQTRGARVALLQRELGLTPDGVFGAATARAVRRYQRHKGMTADGIVGPATWQALGHPRVHTILRRARAHPSPPALRGLPVRVRRIIAAADRIAHMPYRYGGGHGNWHDSGYDCSGSVSYALHGAGLLSSALDSGRFMGWGRPGRGRWVTVYAKPSHAYIVIAGRRFDTSGAAASRWQTSLRTDGGYVARHPPGL
jgi:peptidoglycan hydrolase-like protein with peptidoglycan-binding domain